MDASEAARHILHARLTLPVTPGPLTLVYPKWIPGTHLPAGSVGDVAGLEMSAGARTVPWQRDTIDMYAFHCVVPPGVSELSVHLDYLAPATSSQILYVNWNEVMLYPEGQAAESISCRPTLHLPPGWRHASALTVSRQTENDIEYAPVDLMTLVDSPVMAGTHFRKISLARSGSGAEPEELDLCCESEAGLEIPPEEIEEFKKLMAQSYALFGARHYRHYNFLVALTDVLGREGLEHHECTEIHVPERTFLDDTKFTFESDVFAHELTHSWNGKYRRPEGLATRNYQEPMRDDLLWVYEGMTQYLGHVLAVRSGMVSKSGCRDELAIEAAGMQARTGRRWRNLHDTAVGVQVTARTSRNWSSWRRGGDYYTEGVLIWLEADAIIRKESGGRRALDDFCRAFFGGPSGPPRVKPYNLDAVVAGLGSIAPYDWRAFLEHRVYTNEPDAPLGGLTASGWKQTFGDTATSLFSFYQQAFKFYDLRFSLGLTMQQDGTIQDLVPDTPAARAGLAPGMKLLAVNGRHFSSTVLEDALKAARQAPASGSLELLAENGEYFRTYRVDYHGGPRYPVLRRDTRNPDLLDRILSAR